jgi:hypothetical protein
VSGVSTIEYGDHGYDAKSYDDLASQYHLIFEDWELSVERQGAALVLFSRTNAVSRPQPAASVRQPLNPTLLVAIVLREIPNSLQRSAICSPASRRATNGSLSSMTEHSFQGILTSS